MNRVIAIPQGIMPGGKPWVVAGGGTVTCTDDSTVHVSPMLANTYTRVQLCGASVPEITAQSPITAPIVCMSSIKGYVLGIVATGRTVAGAASAFSYASGGDFDLYLLDPMTLEKIPFGNLQGDMVLSLQFQ